ncbi:MAG TPA: anaerobic sulfatase maturase [Kiritimatiellia bacterium]|nr:anaerobic sulfatase maturase [Kiritimatiellia bacterium]
MPATTTFHPPRVPFHVMTKPIGPICNLDCKYCFYLEKEKLFPPTEKFRMADDVLESYIRQYIEQQAAPEISFAWQGGEPTMLGVDYFRKVVALQAKYARHKRITNAFQTNGTLLNDEWCSFFKQHDFLVGLSVDGPRALHDAYRVDKRQKPTFDLVMRGLKVLKKHAVTFNTLTVVNRKNSKQPLELYNFLKDIGSGFIQFIPLVERRPDDPAKALGLDLAFPPEPGEQAPDSPVTHWSLEPETYGEFLCTIFDEWVKKDVGTVFVQLFDVALGNWMDMGGGLCLFSETCGRAMALEHNGDLYSCDHYVYPQYKLGNLMNQSLGDMVESAQQKKFGQDKKDSLPRYCRECPVRFACHGECPKHRFMNTPDGEPGLNYLCAAYKRFFNHIDAPMKLMANLLRAGQPAADVMQWVDARGRIKT